MKKLFAGLLAAGLCAGLALPLAAEETTAALGKTEGDQSIPVRADFISAEVQDVISVDVVWGDLTFTYTTPDPGVWNAVEHRYDNAVTGGWSTEKTDITLTNHSNAALLYELSFETQASLPSELFAFFEKSGEDYTS